MERRVNFAPGEFYHIYNRGTEKRQIFLSANDYDRFTVLLHLGNNKGDVHVSNLIYQGLPLLNLLDIRVKERLVDIGAWCLMPNHFHLLVHENREGGITKFMLKLQTAYSMYFNKKNHRSGSLFQGPFRSEHAHDDNYLKYLFSYIHLNPIKLIDANWREKIFDQGLQDKYLEHISSYRYSSCPDYLGHRGVNAVILNSQVFPEYFNGSTEYREELGDWLNYQG